MQTLLSYVRMREVFAEQPLFEDKTWRLSPEPWPLERSAVQDLENIGTACQEFYRAVEALYLGSAQGRNLLRNKNLKAPWVAEYFDRGKPPSLIAHSQSRRLRGRIPAVIRPDLLLTEDGFALTEMDTVPGGIGLTSFLNQIYDNGAGEIVGGGEEMPLAFYEALAILAPAQRLPLIAILVSDEAQTYRPEMQWLAETLQRLGKRVYCFHPSELMPLGNTLCAPVDGSPEQIDVVYRFWELFDLANVPVSGYILDAWEDSELNVTPPMRHFQEEKLSLALFHHHLLQDFWRERLSKRAHELLGRIIPKSWIIDDVDLPPGAILDAPEIGGRPISNWQQLGEATQRERNLVIKLSGFHENAWGARSVLLGSDSARREWASGISAALAVSRSNLSILQVYHKPKRLSHPIYLSSGKVIEREGRLRLNPFYFVTGDRARLSGVLATFCPADKKIIHGMPDATMLPCRIA